MIKSQVTFQNLRNLMLLFVWHNKFQDYITFFLSKFQNPEIIREYKIELRWINMLIKV